MNIRAGSLYLDLLKKTLSYTLWQEPLMPLGTFNRTNSPLKERIIVSILKAIKLLDSKYEIVERKSVSEDDRINGRMWPGYADTMIGLKRLDNLQETIEIVIKEGIGGDFIETGVWRGGACIFMRAILAAYGIKDRKVFVADSFNGLPKPGLDQYPADEGTWLYSVPYLKVSKEEVMDNFRRYDLLDEQVVFLEGWFKDSLRSYPFNELAILRLDGDMYSSTIEVLTLLYPKLSKGGFCIIDDYGLEACRKAVDDYREKYNITTDLITIDWTGRYWRKK